MVELHPPLVTHRLLWKELWKLSVPPKVRVFWWWVIRDFLLRRSTLQRWNIERVAFCEVCGDRQETVMHVLTSCSQALAFWSAMKDMARIKLPCFHLDTWATDLLEEKICHPEDSAVILCGMYALLCTRGIQEGMVSQ